MSVRSRTARELAAVFGFHGFLYGLMFSLSHLLERDGDPLILGPIVGALIGAVAAAIKFRSIHNRARDLGSFAVGLDPEQVRRAGRAAYVGPLPSDPIERRFTLELIRQRLGRDSPRLYRTNVIVSGVMVAVATVLAFIKSPWFWLGSATFALIGGYTACTMRTFAHRLRRLQVTEADDIAWATAKQSR